MKTVFVDTGAWLALMEQDDSYHIDASSYYDSLLSGGAGLLTTNYVADEVATRLRYDVGLQAALAFHASLIGMCNGGRARIV